MTAYMRKSTVRKALVLSSASLIVHSIKQKKENILKNSTMPWANQDVEDSILDVDFIKFFQTKQT